MRRRSELLTVRMTMQERGEIQTVARSHGVSVAQLVREFVARELRALAAAAETPAPAFASRAATMPKRKGKPS